MSLLPRDALAEITLPAHGGFDHLELERLGLKLDEILDFSANVNPWGPPQAVRRAFARADISSYPDAEATALRRALADSLGVAAGNVIAGNGSSELIWLIALAFLESGDRVLVFGPTFGEYDRAARMMGADVKTISARESNGFRQDVRQLSRTIEQWRPKLIFLCNPNNPTGVYLDRDSITRLAAAAEGGLLVLDEAYLGFVQDVWPSIGLIQANVLLLRSLTKDYGLAGLRLGYAVADRDIVDALRKVRPPWNVNAPAQAAGIACLGQTQYVVATRQRLQAAKAYLVRALNRLGLRVLPSDTPFFLVEVGNAQQLRAALLRRGLLVRDCASFGLPGYVRIAARSRADCRRLISAITDVVARKET